MSDDLGRAGGVMALATIASRITGFLRVVALAAALGLAEVADAYNVAHTLPFIVYELLLGGVLSSVLVRQIVQAAADDGDEGERFGQVLLTAVAVVLSAAVVVGIVAAPVLTGLLLDERSPEQAELATTFLRFFLPQMVFFGLNATITAILNTRRRFGVPAFASVLNNVVVIATALAFVLVPGERPPRVGALSGAQVLVLAIGTTLGVVAMTVALVPSLRRSGFRIRWRWERHPALRATAKLGAWMLVYVVANQIGYAVIVKLATAGAVGGITTYQNAFLLFSLPHAIVTVSVITALQPRLSRAALAEDAAALRADVSRGLRLTAVFVIPALAAFVVLATPIALVVYRYGAATGDQARFVGQVLTAFAFGLLSFSSFQFLVRAFIALQDTRTPALLNVGANAVNVVADLVLFSVLDGRTRVVGLAAGHALAYTAGSIVLARLLSRRLGGVDGPRVVRTFVRVTLASTVGALGAYGVSRPLLAWLPGRPGAYLAVVLGPAVGGALYVAAARRMHVPEVDAVLARVRSLLRSVRPRRGHVGAE